MVLHMRAQWIPLPQQKKNISLLLLLLLSMRTDLSWGFSVDAEGDQQINANEIDKNLLPNANVK